MKKISTIILTTMLFAFGFQCLAQPCADPVNIYSFSYSSKTYEVVKEMKSWVDAAACAVERGGYLVQINELGEQNAVYDAIINGAAVPPNYTVVPDGGGIAYVWIGATDKVTEGTWIWDGDDDGTGENFWIGQGAAGGGGGSAVGGAYNNWGGNSTGVIMEPDDFGSGQDAAAIGLAGWPSGSGFLGIAGEWNDISLTNLLYFVIEIDNTGMIDEKQSPMKVFPNPAFDLLTVKLNQTGQVIESLSMISTVGVVSLHQSDIASHETSLDISSLRSGLYLLSVRITSGEKYTHEVLILR